MINRYVLQGIAVSMLIGLTGFAAANDRELTKTRPEMKKRIEALKLREARIPFPPPTAEDLSSGRRLVNNGRLRSIYLPESWQSSSSAGRSQGRSTTGPAVPGDRQRLEQMQQAPDFGFKTRLFWIVSRTNDCQYCLGHQELKLRRAGMTDDQIAALDCKWSVFPEEEQAAMQIARKVTLTPHQVTDDDLQTLKKYYSDAQIVDVIQSISANNSTNRWTAATGIPQDKSFGGDEPSQLETPTSEEFSTIETEVAPLDYQPRPAWDSQSTTESLIAACRLRAPLVKLPAVEVARQVLAADTPGVTPPVWFQAMAYSPQNAIRVWRQRQALVRDGKLNSNLKAWIPWICARENRAWYSAAHAKAKLNALGISDDNLFAISGDESSFSTAEQMVFGFARKLTAAPHTVVDADIAGLRGQFTDQEVAEIIFLICDANFFDRFTEMLRLPLEGGSPVTGQIP